MGKSRHRQRKESGKRKKSDVETILREKICNDKTEQIYNGHQEQQIRNKDKKRVVENETKKKKTKSRMKRMGEKDR